ncbi:MAG: hypothetical protein ACLGI8_10985 [Acidimicrobiia bacterium]
MSPPPLLSVAAVALVALGALGGPTPAPARPPGRAVPAVDPAEVADLPDATAALQARLDATPDGATLRLEPGATYRLDGTLVVAGRRDLRIDGGGARLVAGATGDGDRAHLRIVGGRGVVVTDLTIVGANPYAGLDDRAYQVELVGQHGVRLEGAVDVELDGVRITDVFGDFVYVGRHDDGRWSESVWIHDSTFARSGRQGLTVTAGRNVVIERNAITETRRATIDLEPNSPSWGAEDIHILDNDVGPGRLLFVAAAGRGPVDEVVVARNRLRSHILNITVEPPGAERRRRFWVVDNTSDEPATRPPLRFTRVDGVVVTGNRQPMVRPGEPAVAVDGVCGLVVAGNDLTPGSLATTADPPECAEPMPRVPPDPPPIAGRSPAAPPSTAAATSVGRPAPANEPGPSGDGGGSGTAVALLVTAAAIAGVGLAVSARRGRRSAARRRQPPWPRP